MIKYLVLGCVALTFIVMLLKYFTYARTRTCIPHIPKSKAQWQARYVCNKEYEYDSSDLRFDYRKPKKSRISGYANRAWYCHAPKN